MNRSRGGRQYANEAPGAQPSQTADESDEPAQTVGRCSGGRVAAARAPAPPSYLEGWIRIASGGATYFAIRLTFPAPAADAGPLAIFQRFWEEVKGALADLHGQIGQADEALRLPPGADQTAPAGAGTDAGQGFTGTRENRPVLTDAQIAVMRLLNQGLPASEVAAELHNTEKTVRAHVRAVIERLEDLGFRVRGLRGALAILRALRLLGDPDLSEFLKE